MKISVGQKIPNATLSYFGSDGVSHIELTALLKGKKVVIFALEIKTILTIILLHFVGK